MSATRRVPEHFDVARILRDLPRGERWIEHLRKDLIPFWDNETALGQPVGNFPTYRNNDGSAVDIENPSSEFREAVPGIVWLDRDYVRANATPTA